MRLKVLLPTKVLVNEEVAKVIAEAENGSFCLLPRHIDFVTALAPGLLSFETEEGGEEFLAVDAGILVKYGAEVLVSIRNAVRGLDLERLQQTVDEQFRALDEREKMTLAAVARLEANFIRRFIDLGLD
jgi:F-type H+-transporting ATPase subunit epsilon